MIRTSHHDQKQNPGCELVISGGHGVEPMLMAKAASINRRREYLAFSHD
jgi:hypothetical protein